MQTATEKSKAAVAAIASGVEIPSAEKSRHVWLAAAALVQVAKNAEHSAFLAMREFEVDQVASAFEFNNAMLAQLGEVKNQLVFIGSVVNGK
jgi:hypothetical protein